MSEVLSTEEVIEHMRVFYMLQSAQLALSCGLDPTYHVYGYEEYVNRKD